MKKYLEKIDWNYPKPDDEKIKKIWEEIKFERKYDFSESLKIFHEKAKEVFESSEPIIHKYRIFSNKDFSWFFERNRLPEIDFFENIFTKNYLPDLQKDLEIEVENFKFDATWNNDILTLWWELARILYQWWIYENVEIMLANEIWQNVIKDEFQNRLDEIILFVQPNRNSENREDCFIDYIFTVIDKEKYEIYIFAFSEYN